MIEIIGITLGLAFVDCLNPATISTMAVLLPLVKRVEHALTFLLSTYLVYFAGGLVLFYGFDRFLNARLSQFVDQQSLWVYTGEILLGLILAGFGIGVWLKNSRTTHGQPADSAAVTGIKSVHPSYLFLFGIISTLSDLPTAFPLIGFIGKMVDFNPPFLTFFILLLVYVLIYVAPLIALYVIFRTVKEKIQPLTRWIINFIYKFTQYALAPLLVGLGIWVILDGFQRFLAG
jgi:threonine/homoserine/homoserine lactone efflux protein